MNLTPLIDFGTSGTILALVVLVIVFVAKRARLVVTGNQARLANLLLSAILSGLSPTNTDTERGLLTILASLLSALLFEGIAYLGKYYAKN